MPVTGRSAVLVFHRSGLSPLHGPLLPTSQDVVPEGDEHETEIQTAEARFDGVGTIPVGVAGDQRRHKGPGEAAEHVHGVDEAEPPMGPGHLGDKGIGVRVLVRLAEGREEKGGDEQGERGVPEPEQLGEELQPGAEEECCAQGQAQCRRQGRVGEGGREPTGERTHVSIDDGGVSDGVVIGLGLGGGGSIGWRVGRAS